ncbi:MAG: glycosyltransferase [Thermoplasmata archaeon]
MELYKKSKVSIRFGYNEKGPGMGSLEAISWGLPLIINEGIGIRDLIKDSINGYIVNETDYDKIAQLIDDLFTDKNKWSMISYNNIQLAKDLSWENHCKLLDSIFKKIL